MSSYLISEDFLLNHAYRNVWCTPEQDKQVIFQLARVTPENGVWSYFNFLWRRVYLPLNVNGARFHIYQVGHVHPSILGLVNKPNTWISAGDAMMQESVLMDVYNSKGIMIPRSLIWYMVMGDNNLIVAIRKPIESPAKIVDVDLETEDIFLRLYSNAYFNAITTDFPGDAIRVKSIKITDINQILELQQEIAQLPDFGGRMCYVNGQLVNDINLLTAKLNDYVEYVFDASIKREVSFKVRNLQEFESTLDDLNKFLLHYPGTSDTIDYQDDADMYLTYTGANGSWQGAYIHKNDSRAMRMVTHRDYSVPAIRVRGVQAANPFLVDMDVDLRLVIRHSGYVRPLVDENNRIAELYKLPESRIQEAMVGIDSTVSVWKAAALEASGYTALMRQPQGGITRNLVQQAYGYNAMSTLLGATPQVPVLTSGQNIVEIPEGLRGCCTIYEYTSDGRMVYYAIQTVDNTYTCKDARTTFVEIIYGLGDTTLDIVENVASGTLDPHYNYRFYMAEGISGIRTGDWQDKTDEPHYLIVDNTYTWVPDSLMPFTRVLSNKKHLVYTLQMVPVAGVFEFDLSMIKDNVLQKLDIPLGELDIFLNGYSLIEGLDFIVKGSRVIITAKKYYDEILAKQSITIRYTGFCNKDMSRTPAPDIGFVYHGDLSANNRYDIRNDKVLRIVCNGQVRLRKDLSFAEDGVSVSIANAMNGAPYAIRDIIVPMNNYLMGGSTPSDKTYAFRAQAMAIDQEISDYLTKWLPQDDMSAPNAIPGRYQIYSPFLSRIIDDLINGVLKDDMFYEHFGDDWIRTRLAAYNYLLDFDPIGTNVEVDERYVVVHPTPYPTQVSLNMFQYRVVDRIAKLVAPHVDLSSSINIIQI